jgi:hypothetical protein
VKPSRGTGAKKGRKLDPITTAILEAYDADPDLSHISIGLRLGVSTRKVRDTIRYHRSQTGSLVGVKNAGALIHNSTKQGILKGTIEVPVHHNDINGWNGSEELEDERNHETDFLKRVLFQKQGPNLSGLGFGGFPQENFRGFL